MIGLIARREFTTRATSKASIISSSVMIVLIVAAALIAKPFLSDDGEPEALVVQVSSETMALAPYLETGAQAQGAAIEVNEVAAPSEPAIEEGVDALVTGSPQQPTLYLDSPDDVLTATVQGAVQAAALDSAVRELGGDPAAVSGELAQAAPTVTLLGEQNEFDAGQYFAGFAVVLILFFVLIQSASVIMMGIVEEKSSRVVEILLATVRPATLLGGKILGVGLYALVQVATLIVPSVFAAIYLDLISQFGLDIGLLLLNFGVWFVLGFAIFIVFFGGLAALVSRQEDLGAVTTPMMLVMLVPLYLAIYLVPSSPDGVASAILTQIPFFAPFMVPMRAAFGAIAPWEVALAIAICLITIPVLTWVAGRVYAGAVLNTGGRMKLADAFSRG